MASPIGSIPSLPPVTLPSSTSSAAPAVGGGSFSDALAKMIGSAEQAGDASNSAVEQMLDGTGDVHDAMIALQRAELTLQLTVQVRNKLVQAYQEIMKMPV
jgi:flagellar hook-basal body complex protein FliE